MAAGRDGRLLLHCFAGCRYAEIVAALTRLKLWPPAGAACGAGPERNDYQAEVLRLWRRAVPAAGTLAERYLRARGLTLAPPPTLRFLPSALHRPSGTRAPALIAAVTRHGRRGLAAVQRTYLATEGCGKAALDPARMTLGRCLGGAVRLGPAAPVLIVAEGVETALTAMQATGIAAWAALGTAGLRNLILPPPPLARRVIVAADNDASGAGLAAADAAARRWRAEGREVRIAHPPRPGTDFNDVLMNKTATNSKEVSHEQTR